MANTRSQGKIVFWEDFDRIERLEKLATKERRTRTVLLKEALDLLFASREKEKAA